MGEIPARSKIRAAISDTELPTTERWRELMRSKRRTLHVTQKELAQILGISQPTLSDIEKGVIGQSKMVPAICVALGIPSPHLEVQHPDDERWVEAGRRLRDHKESLFVQFLELIESQTEDE